MLKHIFQLAQMIVNYGLNDSEVLIAIKLTELSRSKLDLSEAINWQLFKSLSLRLYVFWTH